MVKDVLEKRDFIQIYGADHKKRDGTCLRYYIHVDDLCSAHISAIEKL